MQLIDVIQGAEMKSRKITVIVVNDKEGEILSDILKVAFAAAPSLIIVCNNGSADGRFDRKTSNRIILQYTR